MKRILTATLMIAFTAIGFKSFAQEITEEPLDTLTRRVATIQNVVDIINRFKISGYIQAQYQVADMADSLGIVNGITSYAGGNFGKGMDKRFLLRRGRIKFQYDAPFNDLGFSTSQYVLQFDVSQSGMTIKDAYARFTDPWTGWFSITAGMQNRPFGYEIPLSSSVRESPERGRMSQIIFPNERDLGAMITIQGPKTSTWNWLWLSAGFFNGTGAPGAGVNTSDFDKFKDFIGHIGVTRTNKTETIKWGLGASIYNGGFRTDTVNVYEPGKDPTGTEGFILISKKADNAKITDWSNRKEIKREYIGVDGQVSIDWMAGITTIRAEYIQGEQPGISSSTASPIATVATDIYKRKFNGAYLYFVQGIASTPFQAILKYDWYDPNTEVAGNDIGKSVSNSSANTFSKTNVTDLKYTTLGLGLAYRWDTNVKITAYYDMVKNETTNASTNSSGVTTFNLPGYQKDLHDNVFTLRVQVKF